MSHVSQSNLGDYEQTQTQTQVLSQMPSKAQAIIQSLYFVDIIQHKLLCNSLVHFKKCQFTLAIFAMPPERPTPIYLNREISKTVCQTHISNNIRYFTKATKPA